MTALKIVSYDDSELKKIHKRSEAESFIKTYKARLAALKAELIAAIKELRAAGWTWIQIAVLGGWKTKQNVQNMMQEKKGKV